MFFTYSLSCPILPPLKFYILYVHCPLDQLEPNLLVPVLVQIEMRLHKTNCYDMRGVDNITFSFHVGICWKLYFKELC
jgi:hypothetical protein